MNGSVRDEALKRIESDGLWTAILSLRTADRAVLILRAREALEFRDIARILRIREGTARARYRRALLRLRELLKEGRDEG